jgi:hypothetical protein
LHARIPNQVGGDVLRDDGESLFGRLEEADQRSPITTQEPVATLLVSSLSDTWFCESTVTVKAHPDILHALNPGIDTSTEPPATMAGVKAVPDPPPLVWVSEALV